MHDIFIIIILILIMNLNALLFKTKKEIHEGTHLTFTLKKKTAMLKQKQEEEMENMNAILNVCKYLLT